MAYSHLILLKNQLQYGCSAMRFSSKYFSLKPADSLQLDEIENHFICPAADLMDRLSCGQNFEKS